MFLRKEYIVEAWVKCYLTEPILNHLLGKKPRFKMFDSTKLPFNVNIYVIFKNYDRVNLIKLGSLFRK